MLAVTPPSPVSSSCSSSTLALHSFPTRRSSDLHEREAHQVKIGGESLAARQAVADEERAHQRQEDDRSQRNGRRVRLEREDRKSTRLNSSHLGISYAVFCLKKKKKPYVVLCKNM